MAESNQDFLQKALEQYPGLRTVLERHDLINDQPDHVSSTGQVFRWNIQYGDLDATFCLLYTSPSPRDRTRSRMPSSA